MTNKQKHCYTVDEYSLIGEMKMQEIHTTELAEKLSNDETLAVIDVREDDEVARGMIPNAKHIKLGELPEHLTELDDQTDYYIICRSGGRSSRAAQYLLAKGYQAINVDGGMLAWNGETVVPS
ncbi:rhodanese-like domain-containing protein [Gracilibacillus phocaeensis]|uniref:rhodanese-like domain-containing protein n=2 Tax=Gracilibacillus TaxID=74385 RepID=UPI003306F4A9